MTVNQREKYTRLIRSHLERSEDPEDQLTAQLDLEALMRGFFVGLSRSSRPSQGLRLTTWGNGLFSRFFNHWRVELPEHTEIKTLHLNQLDRLLNTPWNLTNEQITLYDPDYAMKLKLINGDLDQFIKWLKQ